MNKRALTHPMAIERKTLDKGDTCDGSNLIHGLWSLALGALVLGPRASPSVPACVADDAAGDNWGGLCERLPSVACLRVFSRAGRRLFVDVCMFFLVKLIVTQD
jgi:hypothetical protein